MHVADSLTNDIIARIQQNGVYVVPAGFLDSHGEASRGSLVQALRRLRGAGLIRLQRSDADLEWWVLAEQKRDEVAI